MFSFVHFVRFAFLLLKNTIRQVFVEHFLLLDPDPNAKAVCCVRLRNTQIRYFLQNLFQIEEDMLFPMYDMRMLPRQTGTMLSVTHMR